mgnify:CR=1 FL=1
MQPRTVLNELHRRKPDPNDAILTAAYNALWKMPEEEQLEVASLCGQLIRTTRNIGPLVALEIIAKIGVLDAQATRPS